MKNTSKKRISLFFSVIMTVIVFIAAYNEAVAGCVLKISGASLLTGNQATDIVNVAKANLSKTGSALGATEHWCVDFVCNCARKANIGTDIIPDGARVSTFHKALLELGAQEVTTPQTGDLVFYGTSHVAIMADSLYAYNGNFSGKGSGSDFWTSSKVVYCKYTSATNYKQYGAVFVRPVYQNTERILTVTYKAGGGDICSETFDICGDEIWSKKGTVYKDLWRYDEPKSNGLVNSKTFGIYKTGHSFAGWLNSSSVLLDEDDRELVPSQIEPNAGENGDCAQLTAKWEPYTLSIFYNANGGTTSSKKYDIDKKTQNIISIASQKDVSEIWKYNEPKDSGLVNASTFSLKKSGYTFIGWSIKKASGTIFRQDDSSLLPTELCPDVEYGDASVTLYARWEKNHTHTVIKDKRVEPTCTENGLTEGSHCSRCGQVIKAQKEIPALGHKFSEKVTVDVEPTCTKNGKSSRHCIRCKEATDVKVLTKTGHKYSPAEVVKPTCTQKGYTLKACKNCGYKSKTNIKSALGHKYHDVASKKAMQKKSGILSTQCSVCGIVKKTVTIPAIQSVTASERVYIYNGNLKMPKVTVKDTAGKTLSNKTDYSVIHSNSNSKLPGKYTVTLKFKNKYSGSAVVTYVIKPSAVKITNGYSIARNTVRIIVSAAPGASGYEVYYSSTPYGNYHRLGTTENRMYTSNSRTSGKTYYFRVRAYKTVEGSTLYGTFSSPYKVKSK